MSLRYYIIASIILIVVLYASREFRLPKEWTEWLSPSVSAGSFAPRHRLYLPPSSTPQNDYAMKEKTALEEWIQARLTQQGLKEMTESGHWQMPPAAAL